MIWWLLFLIGVLGMSIIAPAKEKQDKLLQNIFQSVLITNITVLIIFLN